MSSVEVHSEDLECTEALAIALAAHLHAGDALCLAGDLGAGKTAFVTALARALGSEDQVNSPTFTLENRYRLDHDEFSELLHCDLYRPGDDAMRDLLPSMLEARDRGALLAVEWAQPIQEWLEPFLELSLEVVGPSARRVQLQDHPEGWPAMESLVQQWTDIAGGASA